MSKSTMKLILAGLLGAILALPASAKFIGTTYYMPSQMLNLCRSDIARGSRFLHRVCSGNHRPGRV
jgi:hypothetical protein